MPRLPTPIRYLGEITNHIEKYFGSDFFVFHEEEFSTVHLDVHVVRPNAARPHYTLLTSGMSDLDMQTPEGLKDLSLAEVCLCLPPDWPLTPTESRWQEPEYFWPMGMLKDAARYPHMRQTWLGWGHTVRGTDDSAPIAPGVGFTGILLVPPLTFPAGARSVETGDGRTIRYLGIIPLLPSEIAFRLKYGSEKIRQMLCAAGVSELLDMQRSSVV